MSSGPRDFEDFILSIACEITAWLIVIVSRASKNGLSGIKMHIHSYNSLYVLLNILGFKICKHTINPLAFFKTFSQSH